MNDESSKYRAVFEASGEGAKQVAATAGGLTEVAQAAKALDALDWFKDSAWDTGQLKAAKARMRRALRVALASPSAPRVGVPEGKDYDPSDTTLVREYKIGWNECRRTMLAAAPEVDRG